MTAEPSLISVFSNGNAHELTLKGIDSRSFFGGPGHYHIQDDRLLSRCALHHVATLNHAALDIPSGKFGFEISLYYGICHEDCELSYEKTATSAVKFTHLDPKKATPNYPYAGYPSVLPYYRLGIGSKRPCTTADIQDRLYNTGWTVREDCVYAVVSQHPRIGVCLFDTSDDVEMVFEYDYEKGQVKAVSMCS